MTESEKKAAVILAVTDRIQNGNESKPSGYWGVEQMEAAHALDAMTKNLSPEMLEGVLVRLTGEVV